MLRVMDKNYKLKPINVPYKLSHVDKLSLLAEQDGLCAACGTDITPKEQDKKVPYVVDHNHQNGRVRGLLCVNCNLAEGFLKHLSKEQRLKLLEYIDSEEQEDEMLNCINHK